MKIKGDIVYYHPVYTLLSERSVFYIHSSIIGLAVANRYKRFLRDCFPRFNKMDEGHLLSASTLNRETEFISTKYSTNGAVAGRKPRVI